MIFPFEVTYKKKMEGEIQKFSSADILDFFKKEFEKSGADDVKSKNNCVSVKNDWISFKRHNWNRWIGVTSASFQIVKNENNERVAVYKFNTTKLIFISFMQSLIIGLFAKSIPIGLIAFLLFIFVLWTIKLVQHRISFDDFLYEHGVHQTDTLLEIIEHDAKNDS